jgi:hypothetical protein
LRRRWRPYVRVIFCTGVLACSDPGESAFTLPETRVRSGLNQAALRVIEYRLNLLTCDAWKPFDKLSTQAPSPRFSKRALTGTRVPLKTQAPLIFPGSRSTAGHCDQSDIQQEYVNNTFARNIARGNVLPIPDAIGGEPRSRGSRSGKESREGANQSVLECGHG